MFDFDSSTQKSFAELRDGIDRTIMLHCWAQTNECPECGCHSELLFAPETPTTNRYVEVQDCDTYDAIRQTAVRNPDPKSYPK